MLPKEETINLHPIGKQGLTTHIAAGGELAQFDSISYLIENWKTKQKMGI